MGDARYPAHLRARASMFEARAKEACAALQGIPGVQVNCPSGRVLPDRDVRGRRAEQPPDAADRQPAGPRRWSRTLVKGVPNDQRFVYYLLGATGICVVPLTGFCCKRDGFRMTLLECDDAKRRWTFQTLADAMQAVPEIIICPKRRALACRRRAI